LRIRVPRKRIRAGRAPAMGLLLVVSAGGCDSGGDASSPLPTAPAPPPEPAPPPPPTEPLFELPTSYEGLTSYELQTSALLTDWGALLLSSRRCHAHAVAYGDFDGDGDEDTFVAEVSHEEGRDWALSEDPVPVHMFLNEGPAGFRLADEIFRGAVPRIVHPRKALPGDFNGDGRLDIFVAASGLDLPTGSGESPVLILSTERGLQEAPGLEQHVGYFHGAASGDVDDDGDLDIVVTDSYPRGTFLLLNDGSGSFSFDQSRLPNRDWRLPIYTAEIVDVDGDQWPDLLLAGHEYELADLPHWRWPTTIYWGNPSGTWEDSRKSVLPAVEGQGIVVDIDAEDLDGDGNREIILDRTTSEPFYEGFYIQVLTGLGEREFEEGTDRWITEGTSTEIDWLDWLRVVDLNGDGALDLFADDCMDHGLNWLNDGTGHLRPGPPIS